MRVLTEKNVAAILTRSGIDATKGRNEVVVSIEGLHNAIQSAYRLGLDAELMKVIHHQPKGEAK